MKFYIDDPEVGIARATCHPNFNLILSNEIYVDEFDEYSPFGDDEGWNTLRNLEKWYVKTYTEDSIILDFITLYGGDNWGWMEFELPLLQVFDYQEIDKIEKKHTGILDIFPLIVIATTFGQMKIIGQVDDYLKDITKKVIQQQIFITEREIVNNKIHLSQLDLVGKEKLLKVEEYTYENNNLSHYIERLTMMSKDLDKLPLIKND